VPASSVLSGKNRDRELRASHESGAAKRVNEGNRSRGENPAMIMILQGGGAVREYNGNAQKIRTLL